MTDVFIRGKLKTGKEIFTFVPFKWYGGNNRTFQPVKPVFELLNRLCNEWKIDDPYIERKMMI